MEDTIRDMMMVRAMSNSQRHDSGGSELIDDETNGVSFYSDFPFIFQNGERFFVHDNVYS